MIRNLWELCLCLSHVQRHRQFVLALHMSMYIFFLGEDKSIIIFFHSILPSPLVTKIMNREVLAAQLCGNGIIILSQIHTFLCQPNQSLIFINSLSTCHKNLGRRRKSTPPTQFCCLLLRQLKDNMLDLSAYQLSSYY